MTSNVPLAQTLIKLLRENKNHIANLREFLTKMPGEIKNLNIKGKGLMAQQAYQISSILLNELDKLENRVQSNSKKSHQEPEPSTENNFRTSST